MEIIERERLILEYLAEHNGKVSITELLSYSKLRVDADQKLTSAERQYYCTAAYDSLLRKKLIIQKPEKTEILLTIYGESLISKIDLPVKNVLESLLEKNTSKKELLGHRKTKEEMDGLELEIKYAFQRGWIELTNDGFLAITNKGKYTLTKPNQKNELFILWSLYQEVVHASKDGKCYFDEQVGQKENLRKRQMLSYLEKLGIILQNRSQEILLTQEGYNFLNQKHTVLTVYDIKTKVYEKSGFKLPAIDPNEIVAPTFPGREAPATSVLRLVRQTYAQLGFEEQSIMPMELPFWNFDILSYAPEHPDRDPTRVYYLPQRIPIIKPPMDLLKRWQELWIDGIEKGGLDFEYQDLQHSFRPILRTHVTPAMISYLAKIADQGQLKEYRQFSFGRVFTAARNDEIIIHAEGIMVERDASMVNLINIMMELLHRIDQQHNGHFEIQSTYYSYTAPSIMVINRKTNRWVAAGGMIRPEILKIIGIDMDQYLVAAFSIFFQLDCDHGTILSGRPLPE